jgi:hypothetical protein
MVAKMAASVAANHLGVLKVIMVLVDDGAHG